MGGRIMDFKSAFRDAVTRTSDTRGKPGRLGKVDGTLYWTDLNGDIKRDRVWVRVGEDADRQEVVALCYKVTPQYDMPVRVDNVNGVLNIVSIDDTRAMVFSGNRPGLTIAAHAWLHARNGPDPLYIDGLQFLPFLVTPTTAASMSVQVLSGAYSWKGTYKILETVNSDSLSSYVPISATVKHFVIVALNRDTNEIEIIDGDDIAITGGDALFPSSANVTTADVLAISVADKYRRLAAVLLYYGQTSVNVQDIVMDLRIWGGENARPVETPMLFPAYDPSPTRGAESNIYGGLSELVTGQALNSGAPINFSKSTGKIVIVINAGSDFTGTMTIQGTRVDRNTGTETPAASEKITIDAITTDNGTTDGNGNTVHSLSGAYITSSWYRGSVSVTTTDLTLTDVDIYHCSFEQFDGEPNVTLNAFDVKMYTTNTSAEFDAYLYSLVVSTPKCDITPEAELHLGTNGNTPIANDYVRLRIGNIGKALDGNTDGIWADLHYSNTPAFIEDMTMCIHATATITG